MSWFLTWYYINTTDRPRVWVHFSGLNVDTCYLFFLQCFNLFFLEAERSIHLIPVLDRDPIHPIKSLIGWNDIVQNDSTESVSSWESKACIRSGNLKPNGWLFTTTFTTCTMHIISRYIIPMHLELKSCCVLIAFVSHLVAGKKLINHLWLTANFKRMPWSN